jgi:signal transduction histidine kinase
MRRLTENPRILYAAAAAALVFVTWIDYATGYELGFFVFYFIPVALAAWYGSRRAGLAFALAAGVCWYLSDRLSHTPYSHALYIYWETLMRLVSYVLVALTLSQVRNTLRRQQDLLRVVSHDLRSPLAALTGQAQLLFARAEPGSWAAMRADAILRGAGRIASMIDDLVDATRLDSRRLRLDLQVIELEPFLGELLRRMSTALDCERVDLQVGGERLAVRADPARLERIVVNLLSNALRYSPAPARVQLEVEPAGARVVLAIVDHGPGIADEDRPHLFEQYYRGRASAGTEGLGLGLHSTQLLVKAHGGRIRAEASRGGGATFLVELPAAEPPPLEPGESGPRARMAGQRR